MDTKQAGKCPFCNKSVRAKIVEENTVRRDKCECPECGETVYICRTPSCHDYAKGTAVYDHELCPECTEAAGEASSSIASGVGKVVATVAGAALSAIVLGKISKK